MRVRIIVGRGRRGARGPKLEGDVTDEEDEEEDGRERNDARIKRASRR